MPPRWLMSSSGAVPTSVMPKGVEHLHGAKPSGHSALVPTSVMPKGVEHPYFSAACTCVRPVPTSVMPKGVEHFPPAAALVHEAGCRPL